MTGTVAATAGDMITAAGIRLLAATCGCYVVKVGGCLRVLCKSSGTGILAAGVPVLASIGRRASSLRQVTSTSNPLQTTHFSRNDMPGHEHLMLMLLFFSYICGLKLRLRSAQYIAWFPL